MTDYANLHSDDLVGTAFPTARQEFHELLAGLKFVKVVSYFRSKRPHEQAVGGARQHGFHGTGVIVPLSPTPAKKIRERLQTQGVYFNESCMVEDNTLKVGPCTIPSFKHINSATGITQVTRPPVGTLLVGTTVKNPNKDESRQFKLLSWCDNAEPLYFFASYLLYGGSADVATLRRQVQQRFSPYRDDLWLMMQLLLFGNLSCFDPAKQADVLTSVVPARNMLQYVVNTMGDMGLIRAAVARFGPSIYSGILQQTQPPASHGVGMAIDPYQAETKYNDEGRPYEEYNPELVHPAPASPPLFSPLTPPPQSSREQDQSQQSYQPSTPPLYEPSSPPLTFGNDCYAGASTPSDLGYPTDSNDMAQQASASAFDALCKSIHKRKQQEK